MNKKTRSDMVSIAAMMSFALLTAIGAHGTSQYFYQDYLRQDANMLATRWQERTQTFVENPTPAGRSALDSLFAIESLREGVLSLSVAGENAQARYAARINNLSPQYEQLLDTARQMKEPGDSAVIMEPYAYATAGPIEVVLDQSERARLLAMFTTTFSTAVLVFVGLALLIPTLLIWGRMRERAAADRKMRHLALHDTLTGLPNRALFNERLLEALERAQRNATRLCVMCLDLDKFKEVNDTHGHLFGDALLVQVARRLEDLVRSKDMVARFGGDEFVILSEDVKSIENITLLAQRLTDGLARPYSLDSATVVAAASIGIAVSPENGDNSVTLHKNADLALYRAKAEARGSFRFFEKSMDSELRLRRDLENDLRDATVCGSFALYYQPQYDLHTSSLVGYEALVRWPHPTKGLIPPNDFITLAEETGLIIPMGEWIVRRACLDAQIWPEHIKVAVNLSPAQFMKNDVAKMVQRIVHETGFSFKRLELEITESLLLHNTDDIFEQLSTLREWGVTIAMDDFGTGYSSLSYLSRFPFDKIKIDQSFVRLLDKDPGVAAIVNSIISLGRTLSMTIIAEGVENERQADILRDAGCKLVQGYLFGKPAPTAMVDLSLSHLASTRVEQEPPALLAAG